MLPQDNINLSNRFIAKCKRICEIYAKKSNRNEADETMNRYLRSKNKQIFNELSVKNGCKRIDGQQ